MKKILTVIMFVFICLVANAQEIHGYSDVIANDLVSLEYGYDYIITKKEIKEDDGVIVYDVRLEVTDSHHSEDLTRNDITIVISRYEDIEVESPWLLKRSGGVTAVYRIDDTTLFVGIICDGKRIWLREYITNSDPALGKRKSIKEAVKNIQVSK